MDAHRTDPALVAVDWAADHPDGLVMVPLLQSEGIDAFLHNENFVRQDWLNILAYGGFRVLVRAPDSAAAVALLSAVPRRPPCARRSRRRSSCMPPVLALAGTG